MNKLTATLLALLVLGAVLAERERRADRVRIDRLVSTAEALEDNIFHADWPFDCPMSHHKECPWAPVVHVPFYTGPDLP